MSPKDPAAVSLGRKGGKATAENRTAEERANAARKAVESRWAKQRARLKQITEGTKTLLDKAKKRQSALTKKKPKNA
jgi:hypothetical protein